MPERLLVALNVCKLYLNGRNGRRKIPEKVNADKFDDILRRTIEHKPVPKKIVKASRKKKLAKVISR